MDFQFSVGCGSKVWGEHTNYMQVGPEARTPVLHGPRPNNINAVLSGRKTYNEFEVSLTKCCFGLIWNFMASKRIDHLCIQDEGTCSFLKTILPTPTDIHLQCTPLPLRKFSPLS